MNLSDLNPVLAATLIQRKQVARRVAKSARFVDQVGTLSRASSVCRWTRSPPRR